jgi:transposase
MFKRFTTQFKLPKIRRIFWQAKYPVRRLCFWCHSRNVSSLSDNRLFCKKCRRISSLFTGTYLSKSRLKIENWHELLYWFVYEFTANKAAKETKLNQRLIHRCFSIIRKAISDYEKTKMEKVLSGTVEADETYIGPKFRNRRRATRDYYRKINVVKRGRGAKSLQQPIFGLYQRNGTVYLKFVSDAGKRTLQDIIKGKITLESEVYTDTWKSYQGLKRQGYQHKTIDHSSEEYVRIETKEKSSLGKKLIKKIHINGIEGFWGYLKERLLRHHGVSRDNLIYYVKEIEFRFNNRHLETDEMVQKIIKILMKSASSDD